MLAEKFIKYTNNRWLWPPLNNYSPFIQGSGWNCKEFFGKYYKNKSTYPLILLIKEGESIQFVTGDKMIEVSEEIFCEYLKDPQILDKIIDEFNQLKKEIDRYYFEFTYEKIAKLDLEELLKTARKVRYAIWTLNASVFFSVYFEKDFAWKVLNKSSLAISQKEFEQIWDVGTEPVSESFDKKQMKDYLNLVTANKSEQEIVEACQYFFTSYFDVKDLDLVSKELKNKYKDFENKEEKILTDENRNQKNIIAEFNDWKKSLNPNQQLIIKYIQSIIKLRDARKNIFGKGITIIWRIAEKMFEQVGLENELLPYFTFYEMEKGVAYLKKIMII